MSDNNNTRGTADEIEFGVSFSSSVGGDDTIDIYTVTATEDGLISIKLFDLRSDVDISVSLEDGSNRERSELPFFFPELVFIEASAGDTIFINVLPFTTASADYSLLVEQNAPFTTRDIETISTEDIGFGVQVDVSDDLLPLAGSARWAPGQTLGYSTDGLRLQEQVEAVDQVFASLGSMINLDFTPDTFGVFQFTGGRNLGENVLGSAGVIFEPVNPINLTNAAASGVIAHEIGHALGILHPIEDGGGDPSIFGWPFSLMPAFFRQVADGQLQGYAALEPTNLMVLDIEYLVEVYGSDPGNLGDNIYIFNTSDHYFEGFHDGGGIDQIIIEDPDQIGVLFDMGPSGGSNLGTLVDGERAPTLFNTRYTELENLTAAAGDDTLIGGGAANVIISGGGDDWVMAGAGDDILQGGTGDDILYGGGGNDDVFGGQGDDSLNGDGGRDSLTGSAGDDSLFGADGRDLLIGGAGRDRLDGGDGSDTASYKGSSDGVVINLITGLAEGGHAAGDTLISIEEVIGSRHSDTLTAADGTRVSGGGGGDLLLGSIGSETLSGGSGTDTLFGSEGSDVLNGGRNRDIADFSGSSEAIRVDLTSGIAEGGDAAGDRLRSIEGIIGSAFDDTLIGNRARNTLDGGDGDDLLRGRGGRDIFVASNGDDTIADFNLRQDSLDLTGFDVDSIEQLTGSAEQTDDGVLITLSSQASLLFNGLRLDDLSDIQIIL